MALPAPTIVIACFAGRSPLMYCDSHGDIMEFDNVMIAREFIRRLNVLETTGEEMTDPRFWEIAVLTPIEGG